MDRARDLFETLRKTGWQGIAALCADHEPESLILEFKTKRDATKPKLLEPDDKKNLAKPLSAFANVEGGVIVFGISCKDATSRDQPDTAQAAAPIQDVRAFSQAVESHIRQLTDPPIVGFELAPIEDPAASGAGVLLIYVPESTGRPHRVVSAKDEVNERYFARSNTQSAIMPHSQLRAMFGATAQPKLEINFRVQCPDRGVTSEFPIFFDIQIRNVGRGVARMPALRLNELSVIAFNDRNRASLPEPWTNSLRLYGPWQRLGMPSQKKPEVTDAVMVRSTVGNLLYPDESIFVTVPAQPLITDAGPVLLNMNRNNIHVPIAGTLYCENAAPVRFKADEIVFRTPGQEFDEWLTGVEG